MCAPKIANRSVAIFMYELSWFAALGDSVSKNITLPVPGGTWFGIPDLRKQ